MVLLASPSPRMLANHEAHCVVETLCRVRSEHPLPKQLHLICKGVCCLVWSLSFAIFVQFDGFSVQDLTTFFKLFVALYAKVLSLLPEKSIKGH